MQSTQIYFLYAAENAQVAKSIRNDVQSSYLRWAENPDAEALEASFEHNTPVQTIALVLVSDNFLKSAECLCRLLVFTRDNTLPVLFPVVVDGSRLKEGSTYEYESYPTQISTIHDTIYYRDFWYDEWIRLRKQGNFAEGDDLQRIEIAKEFAKKMQPLMNSVLRNLNQAQPIALNQLQADVYQTLFERAGLASLPVAERRLSLTAALSDGNDMDTSISEAASDEASESPAVQVVEPMEWTMDEEDVVTETSHVELEAHLHNQHTTASSNEATKLPVTLALDSLLELEANESVEHQLAPESIIIPTEYLAQEQPITETLEIAMDELTPTPDTTPTDDFSIDLDNIPSDFNEKLVFEQYKLNEVSDLDTLFCLAETEMEEGDFENARQCYERILAIDPTNGRALLWLARLLDVHLQRPQDAEPIYRKMLLCNDENPNLYYEYGLFLQQNFQAHRRAIDFFNDALALNPMHELAYMGLAASYAALGQTDQAKAYYLQACALDSANQSAERDVQFGVLRKATEQPVARSVEATEPTPEVVANDGKVVLITGATSGIGRATAEVFANNGYRVIITGRRDEYLERLQESLVETHQANVYALPFDVTNIEGVHSALQSLPDEFKNIDILINNAGLAKGQEPFHEGDLSHWETMINTNIKGILYVTRMVAAEMVAKQSGHIINIGSAAAKDVYPNGAVYCATKAAVDTLTEGLRLDLYKHNIRVSAVHPGMVEDTEFSVVRYEDAERAKIYNDFQPLSAFDVAETIYYIATRPAHVNIQDVLMYSTQQGSTRDVNRSGRND